MDAKLFLVLLLFGTIALGYGDDRAQIPYFSCTDFENTTALNLTEMSGYWYETARIPKTDVMQCLNVSVPATADETLNLNLEYITIFEDREAVKENISFPWDENSQNGIFALHYGGINLTYKVVYSNENLTFLCGHVSLVPIPLFKVFTRQREVNPILKYVIEAALERYNVSQYVVWTEQSPEECHANAAIRPISTVPWALLALIILWNTYK